MSDPDLHPIDRPIRQIQIPCDFQGNPLEYIVGMNCTRIEACAKNGEYCKIPYVRVWDGDKPICEMSEHHLSYIFFEDAP